MSKREKRLEKLRQNPKAVSFDDLRAVLEDFGFTLIRSSGSHHSFAVSLEGKQRLLVVPYSRPVKTIYVREALDLIDAIVSANRPHEDDHE